MPMLIVTYHQNRLTRFHIGPYRVEGKGETKITHPPKDVLIYPGTNFITEADEVVGLKKNKQFIESCEATAVQKLNGKPLKGCEFEEFETPEAAKAALARPGAKAVSVEPVNPFAAVPDKRMLETVAQCTDIKRLQAIAQVEKRANVQARITSRIAALRKDAQAARDGSDEE